MAADENGLRKDFSVAPVSRIQLEMVIGPLRNIAICSETGKLVEQLLENLKATAATVSESNERLSTAAVDASTKPEESRMWPNVLQHVWSSFQHVRPMYCNVCREALSCVTRSAVLLNGISCEVCKCKVHKRCLPSAVAIGCKWTTLASVADDILQNNDDDGDDGELVMPHQWMEGNLPVNAKCCVCDKTCGSIRRLSDWRCLWCHAMVHTGCRENLGRSCSLGQSRVSVLPPIAITSLDSDGFWQASKPPGTSPLLVFLNSKSGDNQGLKMLRKFKQLLNPAQVFDLIETGPKIGLRLFQNFESFRVLVCGGDGSIGWVLNEIDRLGLHNQCQVGVLPLGTGNDLARVLGMGTAFDDDSQLPSVLEQLEHAQIKMLDRWSIYAYESCVYGQRTSSQNDSVIAIYEDSVANHLSRILHSDSHNVVISSAAVLCSTIKEFVAKVASVKDDEQLDPISIKCNSLIQKLDALLNALRQETSQEYDNLEKADKELETRPGMSGDQSDCHTSVEHRRRRISKQGCLCLPREQLMSRANSIKKTVRQIIEHTEKAIDEQNLQTLKYGQEPKTRREDEDEDEEPEVAFKQTNCEPDNREQVFFQRSMNIPIITTDSVDDDDDEDADDEDDDNRTTPRYLQALPNRNQMASLLVPSFGFYSSSEGDSSACSTPGQVTPVRSRSPALSQSDSRCASPFEFSTSEGKSVAGSRRISNLSTLSQATRFPSPISFVMERSPARENKSMGFPILNIPLLNSLPRCRHPSISDAATARGISSAAAGPSAGIGASFIGQLLLDNADALCAAASPLLEIEDFTLDGYEEKCVMNNYFGIGLDAKIALDFHNRREEHPEKCRSRTKNRMWYGMLGGREIVQKTFKNLEQRVRLECDGQRIPLPNLQGIVILNIQSYMGGVNFWGGKKENDNFSATSFDDNVLEVVAVFGSVQLGISRVINLQRHRIAQCRSVKIAITGDEGVPVQVDGEAWIQPPGFVCIVHKNRAQMLTRDKVFEEALKAWTEKQKIDRPRSPRHYVLNEEEMLLLRSFILASEILIKRVKVSALSSAVVGEQLLHLATQAVRFLDRIYVDGDLQKPAYRNQASDFVSSVRSLYNEARFVLLEKSSSLKKDDKAEMTEALASMETEMKNVHRIGGLPTFQAIEDEAFELRQNIIKEKHHRGRWNFMKKTKNSRRKEAHRTATHLSTPVHDWTTEDVGHWLVSLDLGEYREHFETHDIRGPELTALGRTDLKDLGISKVGHLKRIQHAIKELKT